MQIGRINNFVSLTRTIQHPKEKTNNLSYDNNSNQIQKKFVDVLCNMGNSSLVFSFKGKLNNNIKTFQSNKGFFQKGKAYLNDGSTYTGELIHENKKGESYTLTYQNGELKSSLKKSPDGRNELLKEYDMYPNGKLTRTYEFKDGECLFEKALFVSKNAVIKYNSDNSIAEYYHKSAGWQRVDQFIDKTPNNYVQNVENYYLSYGRDLNDFLRSGEFTNHGFANKRIPQEPPKDNPFFILSEYKKALKDNRALLSYIPLLDEATHSSVTQRPISVYRRAPYQWGNKETGSIITDKAFVSTSLSKDAYWGYLCDKETKNFPLYEIKLPIGTPFYNLTNSDEQEVLLPRNTMYRVISDGVLEYIGENKV